jgi:hypothetical protein
LQSSRWSIRNWLFCSLIPGSYPPSDCAPESCPLGDRPPDDCGRWHGICTPLRAHLGSSQGRIVVPGFRVSTLHSALLRLQSRLPTLLRSPDLRHLRHGTVEVMDYFELLKLGWAE